MSSKDYNTYVYFSLVGDNFNPAIITDKLEIIPTEAWQRGDKGKEYLNIDKLVSEVVNKLKQELHLDSVLQIVLDIDTNPEQSTPSLGHDLETINFLYKTQTKTDIDIYRFDSSDSREYEKRPHNSIYVQ